MARTQIRFYYETNSTWRTQPQQPRQTYYNKTTNRKYEKATPSQWLMEKENYCMNWETGNITSTLLVGPLEMQGW